MKLGTGFDGSLGKAGASGAAISGVAFPVEAHGPTNDVLDLGRGADGFEASEPVVVGLAFEAEALVSTNGGLALKLGVGFGGSPGKAVASEAAISKVAFTVEAHGPTGDVLELRLDADGFEASEPGVADVAFQAEVLMSTDDGSVLKCGADFDSSHVGGDDEDEIREESA